MNTNHIESKFAAMGARLKVREIASRWRQGDRAWINPADFAVDIQRDSAGEFVEVRVPTHLSDSLEVTGCKVSHNSASCSWPCESSAISRNSTASSAATTNAN